MKKKAAAKRSTTKRAYADKSKAKSLSAKAKAASIPFIRQLKDTTAYKTLINSYVVGSTMSKW